MSIMLKFCPHFLNLALKSTIFSVGMKQYSGQLLSEMTAQVIIYMYIYLCIYINREKEVGGTQNQSLRISEKQIHGYCTTGVTVNSLA